MKMMLDPELVIINNFYVYIFADFLCFMYIENEKGVGCFWCAHNF